MKVVVLAFFLSSVAWADDPVGDKLFPPDAIMDHQKELGLDDAKRDAMVKQVQEFQTAATKIQWDLKAASETLVALLASASIDEAKAMAAAGRVMGLEQDLKRMHLQLLVRLKNSLTPAQQDKLRALRPH